MVLNIIHITLAVVRAAVPSGGGPPLPPVTSLRPVVSLLSLPPLSLSASGPDDPAVSVTSIALLAFLLVASVGVSRLLYRVLDRLGWVEFRPNPDGITPQGDETIPDVDDARSFSDQRRVRSPFVALIERITPLDVDALTNRIDGIYGNTWERIVRDPREKIRPYMVRGALVIALGSFVAKFGFGIPWIDALSLFASMMAVWLGIISLQLLKEWWVARIRERYEKSESEADS